MGYRIAYCLQIFLPFIADLSLFAAPGQNCKKSPFTSQFTELCSKHGGTVKERSCIIAERTLGVDWSNCHLSGFPQDTNRKDIRFMFLPGNDISTFNGGFCGLTNLSYLVLGPNNGCPGEQYSWKEYTVLTSNYKKCTGQLDFCETTKKVFYCPPKSRCEFDGPGCLRCVCEQCKDGTKYEQKYEFPIVTFCLCLMGFAVLASVLMWMHRRAERQYSLHPT
ncbi:unnamed protein product [Calicophoron daubneyi]|uniref:Uncharacterized protein n=1 Tax=Calicophoron daubneyi TaxID=300641 RepID=A0AAV2T3C6_CALDB